MEPRPIEELSSDVVDQIAAGEVVERPAHLVKELIENALDAGAREIEVEFDEGGRRVRVTDDGTGIRPSDLRRALQRHATSKISVADDLWRLSSFGFRGEALASIAAVSRLELVSRPAAESVAHRVSAEFGAIKAIEPSAGNLGTSVQIESLFENVPARLKFMKSETAETAQVKAVLKATALSRPDVGFRFKTKGRLELQYPVASSFQVRAKSILAVKLYETQGEFEGLSVEAVFSGPEDVMGNGKGLWFFVQGRWIQDRSLQAAVLEAYRGLLMHGEYPISVVKITAPDGEVDVNISPTKSAVKFRDPSRAFRAVSRTLRAAIELAPWMQDGTRGAAAASGAGPAIPRTGTRSDSASSLPSSGSILAAVANYSADYLAQPLNSSDYSPLQFSYRSPANGPEVAAASGPEIGPEIGPERRTVNEFTRPYQANDQVAAQVGKWSTLKVIGQAGLTYLVCEDGPNLVFVDQHAAHERVAYERLMRAWREGGIEVQALLFPLVIELEPEALEALLADTRNLEKMGFGIEAMGPRSVAVTSFPALLNESAVKTGLEELAVRILECGSSSIVEEKIGDVFARMACHSVVRAGQALGLEQMRSLLTQMDEFPLSSFCPHGRPVSVEYPFARLERDFGRTV